MRLALFVEECCSPSVAFWRDQRESGWLVRGGLDLKALGPRDRVRDLDTERFALVFGHEPVKGLQCFAGFLDLGDETVDRRPVRG